MSDDKKHQRPIDQAPVRRVQDSLAHDNGMRRDFLDHDNDSDSSDVSTDSEVPRDRVKVSFPKRKKRHNMDYLLQELVAQQKLYLRSQRKVMKLKTEMETEEVRTRYLKLDLNNAQVTSEERKEKLKTLKELHYYSKMENWVVRGCMLVCLLLYLYTIFRGN
jgi:hypothetical protein